MPVHFDKSRHRSDFSSGAADFIGEGGRIEAMILGNTVKEAGHRLRQIASSAFTEGDC
jgi:hypothetical protein